MEESNQKETRVISSAWQSPTFDKDGSFSVNEAVGSASISPSGRDVVLASRQGLHIIDLDSPYSPPRHLPHRTPWDVADVQWSPFASRAHWIVSTSNQKALVWNLDLAASQSPIEHVLHAHSRAITDINFSAHNPDMLATCAVDSFVHCWDLRTPARPALTFADWFAGATQVKYNRQDPHVIASSHDRFLHIWDDRKGAYPLRTIEAHGTKIYGIDWNREYSTSIMTCSLDKTIKTWDYSDPDTEPARIIRTSYPVWRARHTPFGYGILAMPQRGDFDLHLFDRRLEEEADRDAVIEPVHSFTGHQNSVREFLWRARGNIEDARDNRDFQLVSWGTDRTLLLHRCSDELLAKVGYWPGQEVNRKFNFTRKGAIYRTYREEKPAAADESRGTLSEAQGLSSMFRPGMRKITIPLHGWGAQGADPGRSGMQMRSNKKKDVDPISWMKGVKIFKGSDAAISRIQSSIRMTSHGAPPWDRPDSLGDEITYVGEKYKKITFEEIDISARSVVVSLNGPWGAENSFVHVKVLIRFPTRYPEASPPVYKFEKTSSIPDLHFNKMAYATRTISEGYASLGRGSLEVILCYLLGERSLEESIERLNEERNAIKLGLTGELEESSSDEEDGVVPTYPQTPNHELDMSSTDISGALNRNVNVPLPKHCGALWAPDGRLVCFFPAKEENRMSLATLNFITTQESPRSRRLFEGFGQLHDHSPLRKVSRGRSSSGSSASDSAESSESSSDSTSSSGLPLYGPHSQLLPMWGDVPQKRPHARSLEISLRSSIPTLLKHKSGNPKLHIALHNMDDLLPAKRVLANEYVVFGEGLAVCSQNAQVASKWGFQSLADIWNLAGLILCNEVPLEIMPQRYRKEEIVVLARRAMVQVARKDSGLDLRFDETINSKPQLKGRVKWGHHPLATWLVRLLFEHFEEQRDVQMLAMLSCIFSEPAAGEGSSHAMTQLEEHEMPMSLKTPAFSLDYYPSTEVAWSLFQPELRGLSTYASPHANLATYGSFNSSNGPWGSDGTEMEYQTQPLGATPPPLNRRESHMSSPEITFNPSPEHVHRKAASILSTSPLAYASRLLTLTAPSSPPNQFKKEPVLSTSAPTAGPSGTAITWGQNTIHIAHASHRQSYSRQSTGLETEGSAIDDYAIFDGQEVAVVLKNQTMFDDEGHVSTPLLDQSAALKYEAYREAYADLLCVWELPFQRCEILKYNGLTAYFAAPPDDTDKPPIHLGKQATKRSSIVEDAWQGIMPLLHCTTCGDVFAQRLQSNASLQRCSNCHKTSGLLDCKICGEAVQGLYKICDVCGHVAHTDCFQQWLSLNDRGRLECETGCGCPCYAPKEAELGSETDSMSGRNSVGTLLPQDERAGFDWLVGR